MEENVCAKLVLVGPYACVFAISVHVGVRGIGVGSEFEV